jgi:threonine/homoserine/homoserine lactone efflux protein
MLQNLAPMLLFVFVATISPGGATALATVSGTNFGFRRSLPLLAGFTTGLASMAALAAAGLATVLNNHPTMKMGMKAAGSAYLIWLAWKTALTGKPNLERKALAPTGFLTAMALLWLNPKGWAMTLSAAASFEAIARGPGDLALLLGSTFAIFAAVSLTAWCAAGLLLARTLRTASQWRTVNVVLALMLAGSIVPIWLG